MNKIFIASLGLFLIIISSGVYFLTREDRAEELVIQVERYKVNLALAEEALNREQSSLEAMLGVLRAAFPLGSKFKDEMETASKLVAETNFLFSNASSENPIFQIHNTLAATLRINEKRASINTLIASWQQKIKDSSILRISKSEGEQVKNEVEIIKAFIQDLNQVLANLTPENSGLSQFQIDAYLAEMPSVEAINQVLAALEQALESGNPQASTSSSQVPTYQEINSQEAAVSQAQAQVQAAQGALDAAQAELAQYVPLPPPPSAPAPTSGSQNTNYPKRQIIKNQGIIIQPGPPRLIQGEDPF